jgi:hypothetical protein
MTVRTVVVQTVAVVMLSTGAARAQAPVGAQAPAIDAGSAPAPAAPPPPASQEPTPPEPSPSQAAAPEPAPEAPKPAPRVRWRDSSEEGPEVVAARVEQEEEGLPVEAESARWQLGGAHFVLSLERLATALAWKQTSTVEVSQGFGGAVRQVDYSSSGGDISLLFGGGRTFSAVPRVAFDAIFRGGFTIGGSVGLVASAGKQEGNELRSESDLPSLGGALFATRAGYFLAAGKVGVWLRGGFTYVQASSEVDVATGAAVITTKTNVSAWCFTLDPQLVIVAAPRVGITVGPLFDIAMSGTDKTETGTQVAEADYRTSASGVTAGVAAIF